MFRDDFGELGSKTELGGAPIVENHKTYVF